MTAGSERGAKSFGLKIAALVAILFVGPVLLKACGWLPARLQPGTTAQPASATEPDGSQHKSKGND